MGSAIRGDEFGQHANVLLVASDPQRTDSTAALIATLGARLVASIGLDHCATRLADQGPLDLVVVEAAGGAPADVASAVDAVSRFADQNRCAVVIAIDDTQIDLVSAATLGDPFVLLCSPSVEERVAAIAAAVERDRATWLNDASRDSQANRLDRLNDEIARIAETLARLTRQSDVADRAHPTLAPPITVRDHHRGYHGAGDETPSPTSGADIRRIIRARRLRDQFLGEGLFEDPAWDMLLDLYAAHLEGTQVSVSSLCIAAAVPPTTALRWIGRMSDAGLLERRPDPFDRRRAYMALASTALEGMHRYFGALHQAGLTSS